MFLRTLLKPIFLLSLSFALFGCSSAYYSAMEKVGYHKRDIMVSRVEAARKSQVQAKEQFKDALEQFRSVVRFKGGTLEDKYNKLSKALEQSESRAAEVKDRIAAIENVSSALFKEWKAELKKYSNDKLRAQSERKLELTKDKYSKMIAVMKRAESRLDPALQPLRDNVLFLKHNLNAQAIAALDEELITIEGNVDTLVLELEKSDEEADSFISQMNQS